MSKKNIFLSFCIPVYNEEILISKNLPIIINELNKLVGKGRFEVIFGENGSTDKSLYVLKKIKYKNVKYISINTKAHGKALRECLQIANGNFVLLTAIDLPFGFTDLNQMIGLSNEYDLIFGSKKHNNSKVELSTSRKFTSNLYKMLINLFFNLEIKDTQGSIYLRKNKIKPILKFCNSNNAFFSSQLAIYSQRVGLKLTEVPVKMQKKSTRKSKYKILSDGPIMAGSLIKERLKLSFSS